MSLVMIFLKPFHEPIGNRAIGRLIGRLFIVVGSLTAIAGVIWLIVTAVFVSRAAKAPGQVIAMERSQGSESGSVYRPVFTFTDSGGIIHTQVSSFGSSDFSFAVGEPVTVLYDPITPKHSKINSFQTIWFGPLFTTGMGIVSGSFACFWLYLWNRATRFTNQ